MRPTTRLRVRREVGNNLRALTAACSGIREIVSNTSIQAGEPARHYLIGAWLAILQFVLVPGLQFCNSFVCNSFGAWLAILQFADGALRFAIRIAAGPAILHFALHSVRIEYSSHNPQSSRCYRQIAKLMSGLAPIRKIARQASTAGSFIPPVLFAYSG